MNDKPFHGVFTALVTPFKKDGTIDFNAYSQLIERQIAAGVAGVVPCGTTGESPTLSLEEKTALIKHCISVARGRIQVMAGTGSNNTADTVDFSQKACEWGADGLLVVVPYYNKPSQAGLEAHFKSVANACNKPIFLYNVPGRTITSLSAATVAALAKHPQIAGIKEATGNLAVLTDMRHHTMPVKQNFVYLTGDDPTLHPFLNSGGHGVISVASNLIPKTFVNIYNACLEERVQESLNIFESVFPFLNALFIESNPVPCKTLLSKFGLTDKLVRLPLSPMKSENAEQLFKIFDLLPIHIKNELNT